ncbi:O-antigen ligase family protein [Paenibacillus sp. sgz500958]|uniref:O-antigen ligase family protein n=1 Tax=Paenibacillus sp. sgz500958 TaxID=3242475 RepID=UPI0036D31C24
MSKQVYGKKAAPSRNGDKIPDLVWVLVIGLILFLAWAPFQVGIYNGQLVDFDVPIYAASFVSALLLLFGTVIYFKSFKLAEQRDVLAILALLLPLTYALSLSVAVSHYMAMNMLFIQCTYASVFIIGLYLLKKKQVNLVIQQAVITICYLVVGFGLMNWLGLSKLAGALVGWFSNTVVDSIYLDAVMTDANGLRLTSIFQYANTYAAFLMAFLFVAIFALIRSRKWYGTLMHGFMLVPIIVSLLLTLSRGGLVMLPVVFVLLLLFQKPAKQILWILHTGISGLVALAISIPVTNVGTDLNEAFSSSAALLGWGVLIGASLLMAGISWLLQRYLAPWLEQTFVGWSKRKGTGMWIPLGSVVLVVLAAFLLIGTPVKSILPANMESRLENINFKQHSVLERITFYKDAVKISKDHLLLGAGGGGWAALYEQYQNNPYTSRLVHNFFLQYLLEVGIIGFLVFMVFIVLIFYKYIRGYLKNDKDDFENGFFYLILALSILGHSLLDFNMSYVFMGILVFLGLAGMGAVMESNLLPDRWNSKKFSNSYAAVLVVCTLFLLVLSGRYISSGNAALNAKQVAASSQSYDEIKTALLKTMKVRPTHPESVTTLSSIDQQMYGMTKDTQYTDEALSVLTRALKDEPHNKYILTELAGAYDLTDQPERAYELYRDNIYKFVWDINWYEILIHRSFDLGYEAYIQKNEGKEQEYFTSGLEAFAKVQAGIEHLKTLPPEQLQGRPFGITQSIALNAGKILMMSGESEAAAEIMKQAITTDYTDLNNREMVRWYLALLQQGGGNDQGLYDLLIAADPTEAQKIKEIVNMKF